MRLNKRLKFHLAAWSVWPFNRLFSHMIDLARLFSWMTSLAPTWPFSRLFNRMTDWPFNRWFNHMIGLAVEPETWPSTCLFNRKTGLAVEPFNRLTAWRVWPFNRLFNHVTYLAVWALDLTFLRCAQLALQNLSRKFFLVFLIFHDFSTIDHFRPSSTIFPIDPVHHFFQYFERFSSIFFHFSTILIFFL